MPPDRLYSRIVDGDEDALRDAWRIHGRRARALARRIAGRNRDAAIVEEVLLLIWAKPERWADEPLDLHLLRLVRDLALIVRRRGVSARLAARELQPPPIRAEAESAALAARLDDDTSQRLLLELSDAERTALEAAWFEGASPARLAETLHCSEDEALGALERGIDRLAESVRDVE